MRGGLFFTLFFIFIVSGLAQAQTSGGAETKKYTFSFTGEASQMQLEQLQSNMHQLKGITEVKVNYKPDSKSGLLYFSHAAYAKRGEQEDDFNPADVKRLIVEAGLVPYEFKEL